VLEARTADDGISPGPEDDSGRQIELTGLVTKQSKLSVALAREALAVQKQTARGWLRRTAPGRTVARVIKSIIDIELADRSMTLAAQEFTSVLPVIIAVGTIGDLRPAADTLVDQFGIDPTSLNIAATLGTVQANRPTFATFGLIGLLMIILSGTSFARALGRVYGRVWHTPTLSIRGGWRWVAVLFAVAGSFGLIARAHDLSDMDWVGRPLAFGVETAIWFGLWALVPYLLTEGRLRGRVLWATAGLTALGLALLRVAGQIYLPLATASAHQKFGSLGIVFTTITWMFFMSGVVVGSAAIVKALALDEGVLGRLLRGPAPTPEPEPVRESET
jgi:membrane protein